MLDNVGLRYPHRASGAKAPRTLRPLPLLRFAISATGGAHLCSIQYYLRFWLGICRTSLAVSALRIMRYCPSKLKRAPQSPIPRHGARLLLFFLLVRYHFDVVLIFRHSAPRGKLFRCGGGKRMRWAFQAPAARITMPTSATPTITPAARQPARPW